MSHIKIVDFFAYILKRHPRLLFGGHTLGESSQQLCQEFWQRFKLAQPDHKIFERYPSPDDWKTIVPLCLHGDKGRGRSKLPCYVFSWEPCIGLPQDIQQRGPGFRTSGVHGNRLTWSCQKRKRDESLDLDEPPSAGKSCPLHEHHEPEHPSMPHNGRGHSFLSRFLCAAIPHKVFKANGDVIPAMLEVLAESMIELFETGVEHHGQCFRAALCGIKGDLEFHQEVANYDRSYSTAGFKNNLLMCPQCLAGTDACPYTDVSDSPAWAQTVFASEPWSALPSLSWIPFSSSKPAAAYRWDIFHCLKYGILKDLTACILLELANAGMFDSRDGSMESHARPERLERAHNLFRMWCIAEKRTPSIRKFSEGTLHLKSTFPCLAGKGADAVLCCMFLSFSCA